MANVVSGNPFILDTVTDTAIFTDDFICYAIAWTSASTTGDGFGVRDAAGIVKYASVANTLSYSERFVFPSNYPLTFNGLKMTTLDTGKVYLYVKVLG
jgi:hypothetical protein